ncbi:hypothetical protein FHETE_10531 [Fusarium heterosporum]|uniref:Uncharacterized protein n=1 Tax=Fusarium heterosporum TaxID=42747 RepID=A0A8H5STD9_FUSHE|nr:hypothetical protein FHETE_10531 [Fusarium heterosporum]
MFEVPEAKRVRREDLNGSDDGAEDDGIQDAELRAKLNAQMARSLGMDIYTEPAHDVATKESRPERNRESKVSDDDGDDDDDMVDVAGEDREEEFAFRLFSKAPLTQKIVLEEDTGPTGIGAFVHGRPLSYYVVTNLPARQKQEYAVAAISGDQIRARSHDRAWGLELPWKVTSTSVTRQANADGGTGEEATERRRRPGKKQRISLRKRAKAREEKEAADAKKMADKEEHIKDKKKRMNRLKKLRKKAKAKEQKQTSKGEDGGDSDGESADSE